MGRGKIKHGMATTRLYQCWADMKQRCNNPHNQFYARYGGRGITYCESWEDFEPFMQWALSNGYSDLLTLDRINNDGNYEPNNCRWTTPKIQANNTRRNHKLSYQGQTLTVSEWADYLGISYSCMLSRVRRGWSMERIVSSTRKEK